MCRCLCFVQYRFLGIAWLTLMLHCFKMLWMIFEPDGIHRMRPNKKAGCPTGVPDDLYNLPHLTGRHTVV